MAELPQYPHSDEDPPIKADQDAKPTAKTYALVAIAVAVVLVIVILHLAGVVGPGSN
jgi:hypothetical protein